MNASSAGTNEGGEEVIDLEEYAKAGKEVPPHKPGVKYRIRIDKEKFVVDVPQMKGKEILALVGKAPDRYRLDQKLRGGGTKKIGAEETVSFTAPGPEKFMTLPLDQTEGEVRVGGGRR